MIKVKNFEITALVSDEAGTDSEFASIDGVISFAFRVISFAFGAPCVTLCDNHPEI